MNLLNQIIKFFNCNKYITKEDLIKQFPKNKTITTYIRYLVKAGYLKKENPETYKLIKHIPSFITKREIIIEGNPKFKEKLRLNRWRTNL